MVKNRALGDSILGLGSLQYIKELYPQCRIIYGVPEWIAPMYSKTSSAFDEILPLSFKTLNGHISLWRKLSKLKIDIIFELHQNSRSGRFFKLYATLKKIPYYFHNHHLKADANVVNKIIDQGLYKATIQRDLDGIYSCLSDQSSAIPHFRDYAPKLELKQALGHAQKLTLILGVVATRKTKSWPLLYFTQVAQHFLKNNPSGNIIIAFGPSMEDHALKQKMQQSLAELLNQFSTQIQLLVPHLADLPALFKSAQLYLGNDTGQKHLAAALGLETITFFGPELPSEWHPYDQKKHPYFFIEDMPCRTINSHYCGLSTCESMECLKQITPQMACEVMERKINLM